MYRIDYYEQTKEGIFPCVKYYKYHFLVRWFLKKHPDARVRQVK